MGEVKRYLAFPVVNELGDGVGVRWIEAAHGEVVKAEDHAHEIKWRDKRIVKLEQRAEGLEADLLRWQQSFDRHVYVKDEEYMATVDAARVGMAFRALAARNYSDAYASLFIAHVDERAAKIDYATAVQDAQARAAIEGQG